MSLPVINTPTYELVLPSTNEKIKFRPFLVKEQKVLLIAQESNDDEQVANAMGHLVKECTFGKVNPDTAPMFDIEYLFLRIRGKAVGETVELNITCPDDEKTKVRTKVNLDEINVQMTAEHTNEIKLSDSIKMFLRYPLLSDMKGVIGDVGDIERVFAILKKCINEIHHGDKIYNRVDITDKELEEFIDSMTNDQLQTVMDFFDTMPKLRHAVKVTNPKTKVKSEVVVEGLQSFLG